MYILNNYISHLVNNVLSMYIFVNMHEHIKLQIRYFFFPSNTTYCQINRIVNGRIASSYGLNIA